ncbi:DUF2690 domain-containing protein [Streptomyces sp. NPDC091215]|uniref:DUF2690 domain-containing protein n=1 Tax=Streptomyces sp. NPDC091215 TaxID=3155192 RepID=UPI003417B38C
MTEIPPECERLAARLRTLRDRRRLTLATLATESAYSRSSWQRWLAGRSVPPWPAVSVLCRLADEPEPGVRALWERSEAAWSRRTATGAQPPERTVSRADAPTGIPPTPAPAPPVRRLRKWFIGAAAAAIAVLGAGADNLLPGADRAASAASTGFHVGCTGSACDGKDPGPVLCGVEPKTLLHVQTPTGVGLEIRYNPLCRAAWARMWNAAAGSTLTFTVPGQPTQRVTAAHADNTDPFVYTGLAAVTGHGPDMKACVTRAPRPPDCHAVAQP